MKLFVGLGNPGERYRANRHNIGFMALDAIAGAHGFSNWRRKFHGMIADGTIGNTRVTLLKPETFMNDSGRAVADALRFLKIAPEDVVVFHDELDLLPGRVKVKSGGGNAGHNGLRSISAHIGNDYPRVRLGIGHPGSKDAVVHYVLNDFAKAERDGLRDLLDAISGAAPHLASGDDSRFLTEIARCLQTGEPEPVTSRPAKPQKPQKVAPARLSKPSPGRHPTGERASKQKSALADNLKKWLKARNPEADDDNNPSDGS